ncbi:MAG: nucleotidyltransferase domain-containing protein [Lachnospiraceae bacterium]|nr:nucleotidyltransferase domain-containing protein [Lachnospiraceae bacterium]
MTKELINRAVSRYVEEARNTYGTKLYQVILFGSCARGDYDDESDVDIMILLDVPREDIPKERDKTAKISSKLDIEFDYDVLFAPVVESKDVFMKYQNAMPFFSNVMKEGKTYV